MDFSRWLYEFRQLHENAKNGKLGPDELKAYQGGRDELARAMLAAQHIGLQPGQQQRKMLRVARAIQADIEFHDGNVRALTLDISSGGFGALLGRPPMVDEEVKVSLRLPGGDPIRTAARVLAVKIQPGNARVDFGFVAMDPSDVERLEMLVFDCVLKQLEK